MERLDWGMGKVTTAKGCVCTCACGGAKRDLPWAAVLTGAFAAGTVDYAVADR
ncbi:MAG: hypothetical protein ABIM42_04620 [candidate division WOR-3 bacterium]